jgi:molecular chaperone IbpA
MTAQFPSLTSLTSKDFDKFFVGYDNVLNRLQEFNDTFEKTIPNYPPYNIKKTDENTYVIEMAVAGFGKSDIEINVAGDKLTIKGSASHDDNNDYLYNGLAFRPFTRMFNLNDNVEVKDAEMINGLLKVALERIIPESKKPKTVEIR